MKTYGRSEIHLCLIMLMQRGTASDRTLGDPALPLSPGDWAAMAASLGTARCFCLVCTCVYVRLSLDAVLPLVALGGTWVPVLFTGFASSVSHSGV